MKPKIRIDEHCTRCGVCAEICPVLCLRTGDSGLAVVEEQECVGCRQCEEVCPVDAIRITGVVP